MTYASAITPYQEENHYQLLEVPPSASEVEIRAAYERALALYSADSVAVYGLGSPSQTAALRAKLREAMEILTDRDLREEYDRSIGLQRGKPEGESVAAAQPERPASPEPTEAAPEKRPARSARALDSAPQLAAEDAIANAEVEMAQIAARAKPARPRPMELPADAEVNGELLRRVRKGLGLSLQQVADRTRISLRHLESVEADRYEAFPALVYLRGVLNSLAREYRLDPGRVSKSYLALAERKK